MKNQSQKILPLRIQIVEKVFALAKDNEDFFIINICRQLIFDYRFGKKSKSEHFQMIYDFGNSLN